jgi:hypothetical protein
MIDFMLACIVLVAFIYCLPLLIGLCMAFLTMFVVFGTAVWKVVSRPFRR